MIAIVTDKPNVGREIARVLGADRKENGYMSGNGYMVTWTYGNMLSLAMPKDTGTAWVERENFPLLPPPFLTVRHVKTDTGWNPDINAVLQLKVIAGVFDACDTIVAATDASREGEMLFRYLYRFLGCKQPCLRLWISSLTDEAITRVMENLRPCALFDNLFLAADSRNKADWLLGVNSSYAVCKAVGFGNNSLGRVQTPTLALVCGRYLENTSFTPQTYFRLKLHTAKDATAFAALSTPKYDTKAAADEACTAVRGSDGVQIIKVERRNATEQPPLLYDLTALQKEANTRHGFSAEKTLGIAQELYEKKLITYPRTGSRYIPQDVFEEIAPLLASLSGHTGFGHQAADLSGGELNHRSVDSRKVTDHHALLITGHTPAGLATDSAKIYDMIAGRMVEAFSPACLKEITSVRMECAGVPFEVRGTIVTRCLHPDRRLGGQYRVRPRRPRQKALSGA